VIANYLFIASLIFQSVSYEICHMEEDEIKESGESLDDYLTNSFCAIACPTEDNPYPKGVPNSLVNINCFLGFL